MSTLFKLHNVFSKVAKQTVVFRVFEDLETERFHVQSCDYINPESEKHHQTMLMELFEDQLPSERSDGFLSIQDAVQAFRQDFK